MKNNKQELINHRVLAIAHYIIYNKATVKSTAKVFAISLDTINKDINKRLKLLDEGLYERLKCTLRENKRDLFIKNIGGKSNEKI